MFKKVLLGIVLLLALLALGLYLYGQSAPDLPPNTEAVIEEVMVEGPPELVTGRTGYADANGVKIWYELMTPPATGATSDLQPKGTLLLIMGHAGSAMAWPPYVYKPFLEAGYQVIRTDHRGLGLSDWMEDWSKDSAYTVSDMVADNIAVLNALNVQQAHVLGVSMGGIIGQQLAIDYPDRVASLTSVMSTGYYGDPALPPLNEQLASDMTKLIVRYGLIPTDENLMKLLAGMFNVLKGSSGYAVDVKTISQATLYELRERRGFNPQVSKQHSWVVEHSGSRYSALTQLSTPTLVVHGENDPLLNITHGKKYAAMIPDAETLWIKNMGHDFAPSHTKQWVKRVLAFVGGQY